MHAIDHTNVANHLASQPRSRDAKARFEDMVTFLMIRDSATEEDILREFSDEEYRRDFRAASTEARRRARIRRAT